jgi:class 3 adenylate cyclase
MAFGMLPGHGATVNVASRKSHGVPDRIQVTEAVCERLRDDFEFERRGLVEVMGKGATLTYFLMGRVGEVSDSGSAKSTTRVVQVDL